MQKKRLMHRIEESILAVLIFLNVLEFFGILPADLEYVKRVILWTALGYLFYRSKLTKIFFNNHHKYIDLLLIISYFMLIFKNVILFSTVAIEEFVFFYDFQRFIVNNSFALELNFLIIGSLGILALAIYSSQIKVKKPSLMYIIHQDRNPKGIVDYIKRILTVYLIYLAFFVVVFNLVVEWFSIAIHTPLIMLTILFYLFIIIRHYHKYSAEALIYKIGMFGEKFYEKFISLFHYKKTILLGISGMLVLHLLTDALSFIIPYILSFKETLYFNQLGPGHDSLAPLFFEQAKNLATVEQISLFLIYILNTLGVLLLLLLPALFWYVAFKKRKIHISNFKISLIISSIAIFFISPIFGLSRLIEKPILGVDIKTSMANNLLFNNFFDVIFIIFIFLFVYFLHLQIYKKTIIKLILLISTAFFAYYIFIFFTSLIFYYIDIITALYNTSRFILSLHFLILFAINILFYIVGFIMFIDEIIKEKVYKKFS